MFGRTPHSAGGRWLRKFGFAVVQAAVLASIFGGLAYFRLGHEREEEDASPSPLRALRREAEKLELATYDWRARDLGDSSEPQDDVVVVAVDDQTLANARQSDQPGAALRPWPRELTGGLVGELVKEGSPLVVVDLAFPDLSPRACTGIAPVPPGGVSDDALLLDDDGRFRGVLDSVAGKSILGFDWTDSPAPPAAPHLTPYGLRVATPRSVEEELPLAGRILSDRKRLFAIPDGRKVQLWAGASSAEECGALAEMWRVKGPLQVRALTPADMDRPVTAEELLLLLSEVHVEGLDPSQLTRAEQLEPPIPALLGTSSGYGGLTLPRDLDSQVRGFPHLIAYRAGSEGPRRDQPLHVLPSAPLAAAMKQAGTRELRYRNGRLEVGSKLSIPMDPSGYSLIRWEAPRVRGSQGSVKRALSAWTVLQNLWDAMADHPRHTDTQLGGRVVVLTETSTSGSHWVPTPIGRAAPGAVMAQALTNILHSDGIRRNPPDTDFLLTGALAFFGAILALALSGVLRSSGGAVLYVFSAAMAVVVYWLAARYVFVHQHLWIGVAMPVTGMLSTFMLSTVHAFRTESEVREFVQTVLGRYVSPEVARRVTGDLSLIRAERRTVSVLFSNLASFRGLSERLAPEKLVELVKEYFTEMTAAIRRNDGQVDKYVGDAIVAFWGAPVRTDRHAELACDAALAMQMALLQRGDDWERRYGQRLRVRVGIRTGAAVVGDMGSDLRSNYTVMGDPVNMASSLQAANKLFGTSILVGEATVQGAGAAFAFREIDLLRPRQGEAPVRIFELVGRVDAIPPDRATQLKPFARALEAYQRQRFAEAQELFKECQALGDPAAEPYLARCAEYAKAPPPEDWDGVFEAA